MGKYMNQGSGSMDVGVKAPMSEHGMKGLIKAASGETTGIVTSQKGVGKNGVPIKGGK